MEVNRWGGVFSMRTGNSIYITSQGTILVGVDNGIERSTDGGESFNTVVSGIGNSFWGFSESSSGQLVATNYSTDDSDMLFESTDDGQSWSALADDTDFAFDNHAHKLDIHPVNDNIIVTGGDGVNLFYRSEDGGETWDEFNGLGGQFVAVCPHPSDGNVWYLGHGSGVNDNRSMGIVKVTDNGGTDLSQEVVANFNYRPESSSATGTFGINAVYDESRDSGYLIADRHDAENKSLFVFASETLDGREWSAVGSLDKYAGGMTIQQGPYMSIDATTIDTAIASNRTLDLETAIDPLYGRSPKDVPHTEYTDGTMRLLDLRNIGDKAHLEVTYQGAGNLFVEGDGDNLIKFGAAYSELISYVTHVMKESIWLNESHGLTSTSPVPGKVYRHDGSGDFLAGLYHGSEDGTQWIGFGETSGNTI